MDLPFWKGEGGHRDFHFSSAIGGFLEEAETSLETPAFRQRLTDRHHMDETAAGQLLDFLRRQREATGGPLPHRHHLLVEHVASAPGGHMGSQVVLHTFWGGRVNQPYSLALDAAWDERFGGRIEVYPSNDCIVLVLPGEAGSEEILSLVTSGRVEELLRRRLEASGYFGARFRECAQRALLLTRRSLTERMPLWLSRLRSQRLLDAVMRYEDFPILVEAWRTCLQDGFDLPALRLVLSELEAGAIEWSECRTSRPSPFSRSVAWGQVNQYMYMGDEAPGRRTSELRSDLLREVVFTPDLRPALPGHVVRRFEEKRQRLHPGYAPSETRELVDWVDERLLIPWSEWEALLGAAARDSADAGEEGWIEESGAWSGRLVRIEAGALAEPVVAARQALDRLAVFPWWLAARVTTLDGAILEIEAARGGGEDEEARAEATLDIEAAGGGDGEEAREEPSLEAAVAGWLSYYGPVDRDRLAGTLGLGDPLLASVLDDLAGEQAVVTGPLVEGAAGDQVCEAENLESLLRMTRADATPAFQALPVDQLPLFLGAFHGLHEPGETPEALRRRLEPLLGYGAPAALWETEILPARLRSYQTSLLDGVLQESGLRWVGCGRERLTFCFEHRPRPALRTGAGGGGAAGGRTRGRRGRPLPRPPRPLRLPHPPGGGRPRRSRPGRGPVGRRLVRPRRQRLLRRRAPRPGHGVPAARDPRRSRGLAARRRTRRSGSARGPPLAPGRRALAGHGGLPWQLAAAAPAGGGRGPAGGGGAQQGPRPPAPRPLRRALPGAAAARAARPALEGALPRPAADGAVRRDPGRTLLRGRAGPPVRQPPRLPPALPGPASGGRVLAFGGRSGLRLRPRAGGPARLPAPEGGGHAPGLPRGAAGPRVEAQRPAAGLPTSPPTTRACPSTWRPSTTS